MIRPESVAQYVEEQIVRYLTVICDKQHGRHFRVRSICQTLGETVANLAGKWTIKMAFPQFAELWKLADLLVRKDFRQANLVKQKKDYYYVKSRRCGIERAGKVA